MLLRPGAMRLVLAALVVATHFGYLSRLPVRLDGPAVFGFFFLSGYWVSRLWDCKYSRCENKATIFWVSRFVRIFPLAILSILLMFALIGGPWSRLASDLLIIGSGEDHLNPPLWSLAVELQFYLLAPLLFLLMKHHIWGGILFIAGLLCWCLFAARLVGPHLPQFLVFFVCGIAYANWPRPRLVARLAPIGLLFIVAVAYSPIPQRVDSRWTVGILAIGLLPSIAATLSRESSNFDRFLGDMAYPIYLFHWPALVAASMLGGNKHLVALVLTALISTAAYFTVDRPLERWRRLMVEAKITASRIRQSPVVFRSSA